MKTGMLDSHTVFFIFSFVRISA